jgi:hypothetical protein
MATAEQKSAEPEKTQSKQQENGEADVASEATEGLAIDAPDSSYSLELSQDQ